jgi:hypothetical protein
MRGRWWLRAGAVVELAYHVRRLVVLLIERPPRVLDAPWRCRGSAVPRWCSTARTGAGARVPQSDLLLVVLTVVAVDHRAHVKPWDTRHRPRPHDTSYTNRPTGCSGRGASAAENARTTLRTSALVLLRCSLGSS